MAENRFFIDHGMIHDTETGKHVTTDEDTPYCDGIMRCTLLLNELHEEAVAGRLAANHLAYTKKVLFSYENHPSKAELVKLIQEVFYAGPISGSAERLAEAILDRLNKRVDTTSVAA